MGQECCWQVEHEILHRCNMTPHRRQQIYLNVLPIQWRSPRSPNHFKNYHHCQRAWHDQAAGVMPCYELAARYYGEMTEIGKSLSVGMAQGLLAVEGEGKWWYITRLINWASSSSPVARPSPVLPAKLLSSLHTKIGTTPLLAARLHSTPSPTIA